MSQGNRVCWSDRPSAAQAIAVSYQCPAPDTEDLLRQSKGTSAECLDEASLLARNHETAHPRCREICGGVDFERFKPLFVHPDLGIRFRAWMFSPSLIRRASQWVRSWNSGMATGKYWIRKVGSSRLSRAGLRTGSSVSLAEACPA